MDEMIWAFEQLSMEDWEAQFYSGKSDIVWEKTADGENIMKRGPNDTYKWDKKGWQEYDKRISNGTRLFGKYYRALWD
jgi:hypothetical protein